MKTALKIAVIAISLVFLLMADVHLLFVELVPEADAIFGVRRRTARRTAVIVGSSVHAADSAEIAAAQQEAAAAEVPPSLSPAAPGKPLPLGTVVSALPSGCVATPVGGVEYYYCSGNFYRAAFQGNKLVYMTTKPE